MSTRPQDTSAEEPNGGNLHVRLRRGPGRGNRPGLLNITEMERGFVGHCPYVSLADLYASAYDSYHAGQVRAAFDQFGRIEAASSMFAQSNVDVLIARGAFRPGTTTRVSPPAPGAHTAYHN